MALDLYHMTGLEPTTIDSDYNDDVRYLHSFDFPLSMEPLEEGDHRFEEQNYYRAGSYRTYNLWRNKLCVSVNNVFDVTVFADPDPEKYKLVDLINFTDCDGVLGPAACRRLHAQLMELDKLWPNDALLNWFRTAFAAVAEDKSDRSCVRFA